MAGEGQFAGSHLCSWAFSGGLTRAEMSGAPVDIALRGSIAKVRVRRPSAGVAPRGSSPPSGGSLRALNSTAPERVAPAARPKLIISHLCPGRAVWALRKRVLSLFLFPIPFCVARRFELLQRSTRQQETSSGLKKGGGPPSTRGNTNAKQQAR